MKRTSFSTLLTAVVIMAGLSINSMGAVNQISYIVHYNDTPEIGTDTLGGVTYSTVTYGDLFNDGEAGKPSLPVDYLRFSVPYNATNFCVTTTWRINVSHNLSYLLYPCQAPRWMNDTTPIQVTLPDTAAYYSGNTYPSQMAWVVDEGFLAGENHIVTVAVMPFSYSHTITSDKVYQKKTITVKLSYELSDSLAMYPIIREDSALREEGYRLAQSMVVNPSQVLTYSYDPPIGAIDPDPINPGDPVNPNGGGFAGGGIHGGDSIIEINPGNYAGFGGYLQNPENYIPYLIVTSNELYHSLRRLAALKRQKGYNVNIVTMDQVMSDSYASGGDRFKQPDGTYLVADSDSTGVLRQFLKYYYMVHGTEYVLLAGNRVPHKSTDKNYYNDYVTGHGDLYYCDLNANWNESLDIDPELYVGRLLGKNDYQFEAYTDKLFRYELYPGKGDFSYLKTSLFTENNAFHDYWITGLDTFKELTQSVFSKQISLMENLNHDFPKGNDILDSINVKHPSFMCSFNHGGPSYIKLYGKDSQNKRYFLLTADTVVVLPTGNINIEIGNGLNRMQNKNYPMIYYSLCCETMPFHKVPGFDIEMNMGESFTTGKNYGGPVYMGNTHSVLANPIKYLADFFANRIHRNEYILGKVDALSKTDYKAGSNKSLAVYHNYLGDPSLEMWTDIPNVFTGITVIRTDSTISISGINVDSVNVDPVKVAYYDNENNICFGKFASSDISMRCSYPNGTIMLYKHNYIPYIAPLLLQNTNLSKSQYVIASDVIAGNNVDANRFPGNVTVKSGIEYEIEASGTVTLQGGFKVENGAVFAVYPSCF